jgi:two-component system chemotaxis response regulator CheB
VAEAAVVVIGGSMGSVQALERILPALPAGFPPVAIAVHVAPNRSSRIPDLFSGRCAMEVKEAADKDKLVHSRIYFAPADYHLLVEKELSLALSLDPPLHFSRPSIDMLFESAGDSVGRRAVSVLLSGANEDGARGLSRIRQAGGVAMVQDPQSAVCAVMPKAGLHACPDAMNVRLDEVAAVLCRVCRDI